MPERQGEERDIKGSGHENKEEASKMTLNTGITHGEKS